MKANCHPESGKNFRFHPKIDARSRENQMGGELTEKTPKKGRTD
jgi:hypothetical protein